MYIGIDLANEPVTSWPDGSTKPVTLEYCEYY